MQDQETILRVLDAAERRRAERRRFLRSAGAASLAVGGSALLAACGAKDGNEAPTPTPSSTSTATPSPTPSSSATPVYSDAEILAFALNLEYLEAQFYLHAAFGTGLADDQIAGLSVATGTTGTPGTVTGGKQVTFSDATVGQYAREIAADEKAHVAFLRTALGSSAVSMPDLNIDGGASGAFTKAALAAGLIGSGGTFDPYASDENFLLAAYLFEDVGVTAYKGAAPLITNTTYVEASAGILATEAYHAGLIRSVLYAKGMDTPSLITKAGQISNARDGLDGTTDDDQGIAGTGGAANIVPADSNSIAYSRTPAQVLNIAYLTAAKATMGGFFPKGLNATIITSGGA